MSFYEQNQKELITFKSSFENFGNRMTTYMKDHALKKSIVITCRVHPGEP